MNRWTFLHLSAAWMMVFVPPCVPFSFYLCSIHAGQLSRSHSVFVLSQGLFPQFSYLGTFCGFFLSRLDSRLQLDSLPKSMQPFARLSNVRLGCRKVTWSSCQHSLGLLDLLVHLVRKDCQRQLLFCRRDLFSATEVALWLFMAGQLWWRRRRRRRTFSGRWTSWKWKDGFLSVGGI